mmetsp:Transcript_7799/g.18803  ORF Transcript_7799/g.18803 Transcript_7799/m.18803 type:complete len:95 (-) Transcript_7799:14-298(-)
MTKKRERNTLLVEKNGQLLLVVKGGTVCSLFPVATWGGYVAAVDLARIVFPLVFNPFPLVVDFGEDVVQRRGEISDFDFFENCTEGSVWDSINP